MTTSGLPLEGKVALVTGGSRGLGREMVLAFAHAGADTVIASRKLDGCEKLAEEVTAATGRRALPLACHVGDWDAQDDVVARVYEEFGKVDILVNNAGMSPLYENLEDISEALFDKVFDVNLKGAFRLTTLIAPRMVEAGGGSIINISSIASERPTPGDLPYGAAKAGLNILTKGFAQAYGPTVRVNAIMAGPFLTDISKAWDMDVVAEKMKVLPLGRAGDPVEIVGAALYLAGPGAGYTTGAIIPVDGGRTAMR
ncbi:glucose 1-dehydrogenase [Gordonia sp. HY285]|uniref:Glucose 1-dehydrogenase n=1 Tax=Gordonia liuliyuniae TaxID=2911517 RepID=A0ABS9ITS4_9ACTN|nr:glucose 1-dehydrogenase [Gordonia liuliyuniae]MCF8588958.1 glucose 1-dehydrogenase [Gordonia liuliyuniae]MCF8609161.1 glucose 1-dehydrogenase [Gordonia liuliyuniae]